MKNNIALLRSILERPWMIDPRTADGYYPVIMALLTGKPIELGDVEAQPALTIYERGAQQPAQFSSIQDVKRGSYVAVFRVHGAITKYDQDCGPAGMLTLEQNVKAAQANKSIHALVFDFDSGGGEAAYIDTVANVIAEVTKPKISYFNRTMASAAYYLGAATDEIYAAEATDLVGSIGALRTFADFRQYYEKLGINLHEVYSSLSSEKNKIDRDAREGKYEQLQTEMLDPYARAFHASVKKHRPQITNEAVFKGGIYMADKAIELNLIDGIKTFQEVLDRAAQLGHEYQSQNQNQSSMNTELNNIQALLGEVTLNANHQLVLSTEQAQQLNQALAPEAQLSVQALSEDPEFQALQAHQTELRAELTTMSTTLQEIQAALSSLPGAKAAATELEGEDEFEDGDPETDFNSPDRIWNQMATELGIED